MTIAPTFEIPNDLKAHNLLVLAWTGHFFGPDYLDAKRIENPHGPTIELNFTTDRNQLDEVDAV